MKRSSCRCSSRTASPAAVPLAACAGPTSGFGARTGGAVSLPVWLSSVVTRCPRGGRFGSLRVAAASPPSTPPPALRTRNYRTQSRYPACNPRIYITPAAVKPLWSSLLESRHLTTVS